MFIVGLTGGIGSGKTTVSKIFSEFGIDIIDADIIARQILEPGTPALAEVVKRYGNTILSNNSNLNRGKLRSIIFSKPEEKEWLEDITHPEIRHNILRALQYITSPYGILSSPLLFETAQHKLVQRTLTVDISEELQVARSMQRDKANEQDIRAIMRNQIDRQQRLSLSDNIIDNSQNLAHTRQQVSHLHAQYLATNT